MALIHRQLALKTLPAIRGLATRAKDAIAIDESKLPTTKVPGQAFVGDLRSTSGLSLGDGITNHTEKWLEGSQRSPIEYIQAAEPIKVHGLVVASHGSDDPALGCPVEYINLKGTTREQPAVCKYTGNKYYSDSWKEGGSH